MMYGYRGYSGVGVGVEQILSLLMGLMIFVLIALAIYWLLRQTGILGDKRRYHHGMLDTEKRQEERDQALAIARERYARGEISSDEYDNIRSRLTPQP